MRWGVLFAGVGGVDWGLAAAGHQVVWAVEYDPDPTHGREHGQVAADYHRLNHPGVHLINTDVQDVDVSELENIQALWASPPCQSHSDARRKDLPERDDAWVGRDILRYAAELEPRIVMIENVPGYRKHPVYKEIVMGLVDLGYTVEARVLNCADYGIPQTRERLIVQARRDGRIAWPRPSARRVGWYEAIKDILPPPDRPLAPWQAKRWNAAYNALGPVLLDGQFVFDHVAPLHMVKQREPAPTIMASDHSAKWIVVPVMIDHQLHIGTGMRVIGADDPAPTVMAGDGSNGDIAYPVLVDNQWRYGDEGMRLFQVSEPASTILSSDGSQKDVIYPAAVPLRARLNARCAARLQTLPDDAIWPETFGKAIRLIGNAVPSRLAQLLAEAAEAPAVWNVSLWGRDAA